MDSHATRAGRNHRPRSQTRRVTRKSSTMSPAHSLCILDRVPQRRGVRRVCKQWSRKVGHRDRATWAHFYLVYIGVEAALPARHPPEEAQEEKKKPHKVLEVAAVAVDNRQDTIHQEGAPGVSSKEVEEGRHQQAANCRAKQGEVTSHEGGRPNDADQTHDAEDRGEGALGPDGVDLRDDRAAVTRQGRLQRLFAAVPLLGFAPRLAQLRLEPRNLRGRVHRHAAHIQLHLVWPDVRGEQQHGHKPHRSSHEDRLPDKVACLLNHL
mmetsp:Transcript_90914/g.260131  ORF Transcript_90914/g.260131 Transcript_90914/m.260131 type:complete len:266 (+) Transcript_90914:48-845(+)